MVTQFPARYDGAVALGKGGGGRVWSVRDRISGQTVVLKALEEDASEQQVQALVREAVTLSELEGLDVPKVLRFGRMPRTECPYLVRELVQGHSLADLLEHVSQTEMLGGTGSNSRRNIRPKTRGHARRKGQENAISEEQDDELAPLCSPRILLGAIVDVARLLTNLHRAGLLHGDVKPANIIVSPQGHGTLVDLGLAAPWREAGTPPKGLTPAYAAPELLAAMGLTVRAEVFALGATLRDVLRTFAQIPTAWNVDKSDNGDDGSDSADHGRVAASLDAIAQRAMHPVAAQRYPSADEFASAIEHAAQLDLPLEKAGADAVWPVVGIDDTANELLHRLDRLPKGGLMFVTGPPGSGRSVLMRRIAWSLGIHGQEVAWVQHRSDLDLHEALRIELGTVDLQRLVLIVDTQDEPLQNDTVGVVENALKKGAKVVFATTSQDAVTLRSLLALDAASEASDITSVSRTTGDAVWCWELAPLDGELATGLLRGAVPSLSDALVEHVIVRAQGRPGVLRCIVRQIGDAPVVKAADIDRLLDGAKQEQFTAGPSLIQIENLLDKGRFDEVAELIARAQQLDPFSLALCRSRLFLGQGELQTSLEVLQDVEGEIAQKPVHLQQIWHLLAGRTFFRLSQPEKAQQHLTKAIDGFDPSEQNIATTLEARAVQGLVYSYADEHQKAQQILSAVAEQARGNPDTRVRAVVFGTLAVALQRAAKLREAREAFEEAWHSAELAGDAGAVANTRLNLAVLANIEGDLAEASEHLEAAIDMGQRAGRGSTTRQASLNLAHLDIYLGRYARARTALDALDAADRADPETKQTPRLSAHHRAQLVSLQADLAARTEQPGQALALYQQCADHYQNLGRELDASEARLEAVLIAARFDLATPAELSRTVDQCAQQLTQSNAHRALLHLARGAIARARGDEQRSQTAFESAIAAAREAGQKEWLWRALEARSQLMNEMGQELAARRDAEQSLAVLEQIAARLPRDLREVFWDDPRRRAVRNLAVVPAASVASMHHLASLASTSVHAAVAQPKRIDSLLDAQAAGTHGDRSTGASSYLRSSTAHVQDRLGKLLEINRELAREHSLQRLLEKVTDHAVSLVQAERGFLILNKDDTLVVHTSRARPDDSTSEQFSSSIAEKVIVTGEPIITMSARQDERMADYLSVHQLNVQSVACVPIRAPDNRTAGALYVETRLRPGVLFQAELPILMAFADQAAVAIENAHLIAQNKQRAEQLVVAHAELEKAHARLQEALGERTAQLASTRRDLNATRAVLKGHFGYQGLVGTSNAMRRVYALIDRVKDMDVPVLITGDSGTGKEMVARAIHQAGPRAKMPFTGINCGAIPEHLLESELFGHVKGAFTGADRDRKGLFRESEGGTVLLDEIGEMPHKMQAGLLRVLQEKVVRPVGGTYEQPVSVRVIAATHRNLEQMVAEGTFREDLYYRLRVVDVHLPSLSDRIDDLPMLVDHFLKIFAARYQRDRKTVTREAMRELAAYSWPGNVRQLENVLLNAWVMSDDTQLDVDDFELPSTPSRSSTSVQSATATFDKRQEAPRAVETSLSAFEASEKRRIIAALSEAGWNRVKAAQLCDMPRRTFYRKLKKYEIQ